MTSAPVLLPRRLAAEFLGSAFLAAIVIGSGIAAQRLSPGNTGRQLLENAAATADGFTAPNGDSGRGIAAPGATAGQPDNGR